MAKKRVKLLTGPPIIWHCPNCKFQALSKYSAKNHICNKDYATFSGGPRRAV